MEKPVFGRLTVCFRSSLVSILRDNSMVHGLHQGDPAYRRAPARRKSSVTFGRTAPASTATEPGFSRRSASGRSSSRGFGNGTSAAKIPTLTCTACFSVVCSRNSARLSKRMPL